VIGVSEGMNVLVCADVECRRSVVIAVERARNAVFVGGGSVEGQARVNAGRRGEQMKIADAIDELRISVDISDAGSYP
jgi:hypothetical protein